jgi:hypothetical protein
MVNLLHIAQGWGKSLGVLPISDECAALSAQRMEICATCPAAAESSFLKLIRGVLEDVPAIYCTECHCPCNEKTLVENESCPLAKW